ncbi:MAG: lasso peptide biosynthesis PqqD family chaperone [Leptolyngbyaceae cyanobacterium CSU_1_4]|nr:lasso peptide biosynthesis PqqD family chaperone [Leptolyngbyaceae cyanobacterium CSU_1_4]
MTPLKTNLLALHAVVVATQGQISSNLAGEAVILDLASGVYYGLNEVGAKIWHLIQQPCTIQTIQQSLLQEYDVEPEICTQDLLQLLQELQAAGLINISHETPA